ncbi:phosphatase PAP2 family protein [Aerococcaceae bacterium WGS1372]
MNTSKHYINKALIAIIPFLILLIWSMVDVNSLQHLDNRITLASYDIRTEWLTPFFMTITLLGNPPVMVALTIILALFVYLRHRQTLLSLWVVLMMAIGSLGINPLVKNLIGRQRPDENLRLVAETTFSFPSGHAFASMSLFGALIIILLLSMKESKWRTLLITFIGLTIILIGFSRLYLGVHYFSDIIAGYSLGLAWLLVSYSFVQTHLRT